MNPEDSELLKKARKLRKMNLSYRKIAKTLSSNDQFGYISYSKVYNLLNPKSIQRIRQIEQRQTGIINENIAEIRGMLTSGESPEDIAEYFGVYPYTIARISTSAITSDSHSHTGYIPSVRDYLGQTGGIALLSVINEEVGYLLFQERYALPHLNKTKDISYMIVKGTKEILVYLEGYEEKAKEEGVRIIRDMIENLLEEAKSGNIKEIYSRHKRIIQTYFSSSTVLACAIARCRDKSAYFTTEDLEKEKGVKISKIPGAIGTLVSFGLIKEENNRYMFEPAGTPVPEETEKVANIIETESFEPAEPAGTLVSEEIEKAPSMIETESFYDIEKINQILTECYNEKIQKKTKRQGYGAFLDYTPTHIPDNYLNDKGDEFSKLPLSAKEIDECLDMNPNYSKDNINLPELISELKHVGWSGNRSIGYKPLDK